MTLTTLQLARRIADAVLSDYRGMRGDQDAEDWPTQAVLRVLHNEGSWFCRLRNDPVKGTIAEQMEMFP